MNAYEIYAYFVTYAYFVFKSVVKKWCSTNGTKTAQ